MPQHGEKSHKFFEWVQKAIPYGVNSNFRYSGDDQTLVAADARSGCVYDFCGKSYIDYRLGFGPDNMGHTDPFVNGRAKEAIDHGLSFAATQHYEGQVGEILNRYGIPHFISGIPAKFGVTFMDTQPRNWRDFFKADWDLYEEITSTIIENGLMPDPDGFEPYFLCVDHNEENAAETLQVFEEGLKITPS